MNRAVILAGGNTGDVEQRIEDILRTIATDGNKIIATSGYSKTEPWGFHSNEMFTNLAFEIGTGLTAEELLHYLQSLEKIYGRNREEEATEKQKSGQRYASRPIDLDILFFNNERISTKELTVPHPRITEREFTIELLCRLWNCTKEEIIKLCR